MAKVLLFGRLADTTGWRARDIPLPEGVATVAALRAHLATTWPNLAAPSIRFAVNREIAGETALLHDADEIALMPPMSGG
jgi:molybdopterin synthase sulfur carrier subunit